MYIFTTFIQPLEIFFQRQQQKHEQHKEIRKNKNSILEGSRAREIPLNSERL